MTVAAVPPPLARQPLDARRGPAVAPRRRPTRAARALVLGLALLALLGAGLSGTTLTGTASAATPRTTLQDVEGELMCSTCRVPLEQSDSPQANQERETIERLIAQGKTKDQVIDEMVSIYTETVLIDPPDKAVRTLRWLLPVVGAAIAALLLTVLVRRWRRRAAVEPPDGPPPGDDPGDDGLSDDERRRLDTDLARYG